MSTKPTKAKPCPWCLHDEVVTVDSPSLYRCIVAQCDECGIHGPAIRVVPGEEPGTADRMAVNAWNSRKELP